MYNQMVRTRRTTQLEILEISTYIWDREARRSPEDKGESEAAGRSTVAAKSSKEFPQCNSKPEPKIDVFASEKL